ENAIEATKASEAVTATTTNSKNMVQTPEGVYMRNENGTITIRHLTIRGFIDNIIDNIIKVEYIDSQGNKTEVDANQELSNAEGGVYIITTDNGVYGVTMGKHSRLEITQDTWDLLETNFNIKFMDSPVDPQRKVNSRGYIVN